MLRNEFGTLLVHLHTADGVFSHIDTSIFLSPELLIFCLTNSISNLSVHECVA